MTKIKKKIINLCLTGLSSPIDKFNNKTLNELTLDDLKALSFSNIIRLFKLAYVPDFLSLKGEYRAVLLEKGPFRKLASFYTHKVFGPGEWIGKAFYPLLKTSGIGYNIFSKKYGDGKEKIFRAIRMNTYVDISNLDEKRSVHIDYSPWNLFLNATMHDEIRMINENLFLGIGYMSISFGALNPAPFVLLSPGSLWIGPDKNNLI